MKASVKIILAVLCIALIIGAVSAKGNPPGNTGKSETVFINLTEKDSSVVAPNGSWGWILNGGFGKLQDKTAPGASFVFNAAKMTRNTEYALISYAEPYPGTRRTILGTAVSDRYGAVSIKGKTDVTTGFVCNRYPTPTSNEYLVNGTKIWLVPTSDLSMPLITSNLLSFDTTYFTSWNDADYLFETDLVNKGCIAPEEVSCDPGYADCDGNPANGCETNLDTDTGNCGSCGTACSVDWRHSVVQCRNLCHRFM